MPRTVRARGREAPVAREVAGRTRHTSLFHSFPLEASSCTPVLSDGMSSLDSVELIRRDQSGATRVNAFDSSTAAASSASSSCGFAGCIAFSAASACSAAITWAANFAGVVNPSAFASASNAS